MDAYGVSRDNVMCLSNVIDILPKWILNRPAITVQVYRHRLYHSGYVDKHGRQHNVCRPSKENQLLYVVTQRKLRIPTNSPIVEY